MEQRIFKIILAVFLILSAFISQKKIFAQSQPVIFNPVVIPKTANEIINPMRGYSKWNDQERITSQVMPHMDAYKRYNWRDFETTQPGVYNFTLLDNDLAKAAAEGQKLRFGIRALRGIDDSYYAGMHVPDDLEPYGWVVSNGNGSFFIPDWNHEVFLNRAENLLMALGNRYNNDPRVSAINIRMYGLYGEWHMSGVNYSNAPTKTTSYCSQSICVNNKPIKPGNGNGAATLRRIIDMHIRAFPSKQLIAMIGQSDSTENVSDALMYAMSRTVASDPPVSKPIGWRNECLGVIKYSDGAYHEHFRDASTFTHWGHNTYTNDASESLVKNRWMYAPVDTEYCPISSTMMNSAATDVFVKAKSQILDFHVSLLGNGNMDVPPASRVAEAIEAGKTSGYRLVLKSVTLPNLNSGGSLEIQSVWENQGVAPVYEDWNIYYQLRAGTNIVWNGKSTLTIRNILPTVNSPFTHTDNLSSLQLPNGNYSLLIKICDPLSSICNTNQTPTVSGNVRRPLALAINGRGNDGSYLLGTVAITGINPTVTVSPSPVRTVTPTHAPTATSIPLNIPGNLNTDNVVNILDYGLFKNYFRQKILSADFDNNNKVDIFDLTILIKNFGRSN